MIRSLEGIRNTRTMAFVIGALLVVAALFAVVAVGFRGRDVARGAAAMTAPVPAARSQPPIVSARP